MGASTTNEALAATLFEHAGLIVPNNAATGMNLRAALTTQLIGMKAADHGTSASDYAATPQGTGLRTLIGRLSDADLAHGAARVATNFTVTTNTLPSDLMHLPWVPR